MNLRFQKVTGELKNLSRIRVVRRSIAMINTLINAKKRNSEK
jgi:ribosomal protein L29